METPMLVTKAPGKVILFGEHAVVYGHPSIAASVDLHTYIFVSGESAEYVELDFPMVQLDKKWRISEIPFVETPLSAPETFNPNVVASLEPLLSDLTNPFARASALAFLYLYVHICSPKTPGRLFRARSTLPVGAGLGSSASFSVALAAALLETAGNTSFSKETINSYAFLGESCIHGNPSGIDNLVASMGGAVRFRRGAPADTITMPSVDLMLTNTKVPRQTSQLVAGVAERKAKYPALIDPVLESIGELSNQVHQLITTCKDKAVLAKQLQELASINHGLLIALGVSHPSLETVRIASTRSGLGETKLTGAGGGGCAITFIDKKSASEEFKRHIDHMEVFETSIGGPGVGVSKLDGSSNLDNFSELPYEWSYY